MKSTSIDQKLAHALEAFASSSRYTLLKGLQVGRFVKADSAPIGAVSGLTFEKLIELGTKKILKLGWLDEVQKSDLLAILSALTGANETDQYPTPAISSAECDQDEREGSVVSSAEAENRLRSALRNLKELDSFGELRSRCVGDFWDASWPRAPFEESMSLGQLASIDLAMLWKKKSMTGKRLACIADAVQRAIASKSLNSIGESIEHSAASSLIATTDSSSSKAEGAKFTPNLSLVREIKPQVSVTNLFRRDAHPWLANNLAIAPLMRAGLEQYLHTLSQLTDEPTNLSTLTRVIADTLTPEDILSALDLSGCKLSLTPTMSLLINTPEFIKASHPIALALQGPGLSLNSVIELLLGSIQDRAISRSVIEIVAIVSLRLLGGGPVSVAIKGGSIHRSEVWSCNPQLAGLIFDSIRKSGLEALPEKLDPALKGFLGELFTLKSRRSKPRKNLPK